MRRREGGILAPIRQEPDDFRERNYPFEHGSRGEKSKTADRGHMMKEFKVPLISSNGKGAVL